MAEERKKYDKTFKIKAVELSFARNNVKDVADELGISAQQLSIWRGQYRENKDIELPPKRICMSEFPGLIGFRPNPNKERSEQLIV